ncbi:MAG: ATP-binding protein [Acholeplasmataceae bacterium]
MNLDFTQTKQMELKREYSDNLLKTVVAFANYSGGALIIGIDEKNKEVIGVSDYINSKLNIENKINVNLNY